jgi:hypothetical protein
MYRYGASETTTAAAVAPPPPPPPMYTHMTLVGGPAANLPTHGHNQIFVNNVKKYILCFNKIFFFLLTLYIVAVLNNLAGFN